MTSLVVDGDQVCVSSVRQAGAVPDEGRSLLKRIPRKGWDVACGNPDLRWNHDKGIILGAVIPRPEK